MWDSGRGRGKGSGSGYSGSVFGGFLGTESGVASTAAKSGIPFDAAHSRTLIALDKAQGLVKPTDLAVSSALSFDEFMAEFNAAREAGYITLVQVGSDELVGLTRAGSEALKVE